MPAKPLTPPQLEDAARLRQRFHAWQEARREHGQPSSQEAAAAELGFGQSALSQYLRGDIPLNPKRLAGMARLFGCLMEDISPSLTAELRTQGLVPAEHDPDQSNAPNTGANGQLFNSTSSSQPDTLLSGKLAGEKLTDGRSSVSFRPILAWSDVAELGEGYVLIPRLDVKFSAGNGRIVWHVDEKGQKQAFRKAWCDRLGINPEHAATLVAEGQSMESRIQDGDSLVVDYKDKELIDGKIFAIAYRGELFIKRLFKLPGGGLRIHSDNPDKSRFPDMNLGVQDIQYIEIIARVKGISGGV